MVVLFLRLIRYTAQAAETCFWWKCCKNSVSFIVCMWLFNQQSQFLMSRQLWWEWKPADCTGTLYAAEATFKKTLQSVHIFRCSKQANAAVFTFGVQVWLWFYSWLVIQLNLVLNKMRMTIKPKQYTKHSLWNWANFAVPTLPHFWNNLCIELQWN